MVHTRSPLGQLNQIQRHEDAKLKVFERVRGRKKRDKELAETIQLSYGSLTIADVYKWTVPGEVLSDPYGRGTLDRIK